MGNSPPLKIRRLPHEQWAAVDENYRISNMGRWYSEKKRQTTQAGAELFRIHASNNVR